MAVLKYWDGAQWVSVGFATAWQAGDLKMSFRSTAPDGWLICDGSLVSQATYADLFEAIGHSANDGNDPGGGNFKLPDFRDRYPIGKGTGTDLGDVVGSNDAVVVSHTHIQNAHSHTQDAHDHTQAVHNHEITDPGHEHAIDGDYGNRVAVTVVDGAHIAYPDTGIDGKQDLSWSDIDANTTGISVNGAQPAVNGNTATNQNATATNQAQGASGTGANRPASQAVNYLIKT